MSESNDNTLTLIIHDDGGNFPKEVELGAVDSLGLKLVIALTNRLSGRVDLDTTNGTTFKIIFNDYKYRERKHGNGTRTDHDC